MSYPTCYNGNYINKALPIMNTQSTSFRYALLLIVVAVASGYIFIKREQVVAPVTTNATGGTVIHAHYLCENKKEINATYDNTDPRHTFALVQLDIKSPVTLKMETVMSGSGAKYSNGVFDWWTKGRTAFLQDSTGDNHIIFSSCNQTDN
jgi:membrane-bound inhibitor of C-type lysozyme